MSRRNQHRPLYANDRPKWQADPRWQHVAKVREFGELPNLSPPASVA